MSKTTYTITNLQEDDEGFFSASLSREGVYCGVITDNPYFKNHTPTHWVDDYLGGFQVGDTIEL